MPPLPDLNAAAPCGFGRMLTGNVAVSGRSFAEFVTTLSQWVGRPVIDKTGLTGLYDFTLKFSPEGIRAAGPMGPTLTLRSGQGPAPGIDPNAPSLPAALQEQLGFKLDFHKLPAFGQVSTGNLKLILSGPGASGSRPLPDGRQQEPGGWNRVILEVENLPARIEVLKEAGMRLRNEMEVGPGGKQVQLEDPDGNPIELFEPAG